MTASTTTAIPGAGTGIAAPAADGDLVALAERVAGWAGTGEEVEVYVARGRETEVRAYDGDVESLTSATSAGIGVRVVTDHRLGFAWAGSLEEAVLGETLTEARDNARYATPDEHVQLAMPDGVAPAALDVWDDELDAVPTSAKVDLALDLEARARGADPRIRQVDGADYGDGLVEVALVSTRGIRAQTRKTSAFVSARVIAGQDEGSQTGAGYSVGRGFAALDPEKAASEAVDRAVRMLGATKGSSGRRQSSSTGGWRPRCSR